MIGIYKITSPSGRIYVGQAVNIERRFKEYKNLNHSKYQTKLHNSFNKYKIENHIFEILEECNIEILNEKERYWQDYYNVLYEGLNCKLTTTNDKSGCLSDDVKMKLSIAGKGKKHTEEHIKKRMISHIGSKRSEESKKLMSEKAKNKIFTEEHRRNMSNSRKNRIISEETKLKISLSNKGRIVSEETKLKLKLSIPSGANHKDAKKVICTNTQKIWGCIKDCSKDVNISYNHLRNILSGKKNNKTTLKYYNND